MKGGFFFQIYIKTVENFKNCLDLVYNGQFLLVEKRIKKAKRKQKNKINKINETQVKKVKKVRSNKLIILKNNLF